MKYLVKYKLFESKLESEPTIDEVRSRIFRFYAAIPTVRSKASLVIQKIITEYGISYDIFKDKTIDLKSIGGSEDTKENKHVKLRNGLRFQDYITKLLGETDNTEDDSSDKATRGFDFEGLIAGFFGGKFSNNPSSTYDIENNDKKFSIKFSEYKDIVLTSITKIIDKLKEPENRKDKECWDIIRNYKLLEVLYADNTKFKSPLYLSIICFKYFVPPKIFSNGFKEFLTPKSFAVPSINCIKPFAPTGETASCLP